jgi:MscS family membrane protein
MDWWQDLIQQNYDWLWEAGLALLITLIIALAWRSIRKRLEAVISKSKNRWDDITLKAFGIPVNWLIIIIGGAWFADITARHFSTEMIDNIPVARQLAVLVVIAWGVWRLISGIEVKQLDKGNDPTTVQLVGKVTKLTLTILIVLPIFHFRHLYFRHAGFWWYGWINRWYGGEGFIIQLLRLHHDLSRSPL